MGDMAHSICLIKLYQITMRKNFDVLFLTTLNGWDFQNFWERQVEKCDQNLKNTQSPQVQENIFSNLFLNAQDNLSAPF